MDAQIPRVQTLEPDSPAGMSITQRKEGWQPVGIEPGMRFAVREGSKTVGAGVVLTVE